MSPLSLVWGEDNVIKLTLRGFAFSSIRGGVDKLVTGLSIGIGVILLVGVTVLLVGVWWEVGVASHDGDCTIFKTGELWGYFSSAKGTPSSFSSKPMNVQYPSEDDMASNIPSLDLNKVISYNLMKVALIKWTHYDLFNE